MPKLTVKTASDLKVGSQDKNFVSVEIESTETIELGASIDIPRELCGDPKVAELNFEYVPPNTIATPTLTKMDDKLAWETDERFSLDAGVPVTIRITGFNPESSCDKAGLQLKIWDDPDVTPMLYNELIPVPVLAAAGVAIISFDVGPTNILRGEDVTISSYTTGADTVTLFANDKPEPDPKSQPEPGGRRDTWLRNPEVETTYRLEAWRDKSGGSKKDGQFADREVTVTAEPRPKWYTQDLITNSLRGARVGQHFYPTLLLAAKDLRSNVGYKLYGIFVCKETKYAGLWSSSSGFDGWRWEADVPEGMGESPGVIHNQALWLIGGSSADPLGPISNRVYWWYYSEKDTKMVWREWDKEGSERKALAKAGKATPAPVRCHACATFGTPEKVWVMGGLSEHDTTLDEVWTCSADPRNGNFTPSWEKRQPLPSARCMSAAVATLKSPNIQGVAKSTLWLYGGTTHPYNRYETFDELLYTEDGKTWRGEDLDVPMKLAQAATLLYDSGDKLLHLVGVFETGTFDHALRDVIVEPTGWDKGSLTKFGWDYKTELFLMRSVCFRERWILWPVYQNWDGKEKYDARIYNTP